MCVTSTIFNDSKLFLLCMSVTQRSGTARARAHTIRTHARTHARICNRKDLESLRQVFIVRSYI